MYSKLPHLLPLDVQMSHLLCSQQCPVLISMCYFIVIRRHDVAGLQHFSHISVLIEHLQTFTV